MIGQKFGRLSVVRHAGRSGGRDTWLCLCDCSKTVTVRQNNLRSGNTTSCGCAHVRHGRAKKDVRDLTYNSWQNMIARVDGQRGEATAANYSARGISMCERWRGFDAFLEDMGVRPVGTTLDRIDNDRGYECGVCEACVSADRNKNCRWATRKDQQRNRRTNALLTYNGETACLSEWSERLGMGRGVLRKRIDSGWSVEEALTTPAKGAAT